MASEPKRPPSPKEQKYPTPREGAQEPGVGEAADSGLPGYGQAPPGVRTDRLEGGPEFDWEAQQAPKK